MAVDARRLARGMSYKNALAGLPLGGGKAVLQVPAGPFDRPALFRAFGQAIERLAGIYVTAEDVGTTVADMLAIREKTRYVAGLTSRPGMAGGDPSPWTALGVFVAIQVVAETLLHREIAGLTVAIQGAGSVGSKLAKLLVDAGAQVIVADVQQARADALAQDLSCKAVAAEDIVPAPADIFAPCAPGGVIDDAALDALKARAICGAANNQLAAGLDPGRLAASGVAYMPDYLVNAGGIINAAAEYLGEPDSQVKSRVRAIGQRLSAVLSTTGRTSSASTLACDQVVASR